MYDGRREKKQRKTMTTDRHGREMTVKPAEDTPMKRFFESVDHETLHYALAENPKYAAFLAALLNPEFKRYTFMRIARDHGFTLHELQVLYTDFSRHMALLQALPNAAKALPQVMNDTIENSKNKLVVCPRCDGKKQIIEIERDGNGKVEKTNLRDCPVCKASGEVTALGDKHALDQYYEIMKLTNVKAPININNTMAVGVSNNSMMNNDMEKLLRLSAQMTMGRREQDHEHKPDQD